MDKFSVIMAAVTGIILIFEYSVTDKNKLKALRFFRVASAFTTFGYGLAQILK